MPLTDENLFDKSEFDKMEKQKMKKQKNSSLLFYIAAVLFDLAAIITFASGNQNSIGAVWLCLGSMFLCLGASYARKSKENEEKKDDEEK